MVLVPCPFKSQIAARLRMMADNQKKDIYVQHLSILTFNQFAAQLHATQRVQFSNINAHVSVHKFIIIQMCVM